MKMFRDRFKSRDSSHDPLIVRDRNRGEVVLEDEPLHVPAGRRLADDRQFLTLGNQGRRRAEGTGAAFDRVKRVLGSKPPGVVFGILDEEVDPGMQHLVQASTVDADRGGADHRSGLRPTRSDRDRIRPITERRLGGHRPSFQPGPGGRKEAGIARGPVIDPVADLRNPGLVLSLRTG